MYMGPHCSICKKEEDAEDWNGDRQETECQQRNYYPQNLQHLQSYDIPDRYSQQINLQKEWNEKMEHLNEKYNLDYYSSSKSDSDFEFDFEPEYKYETLI